MKEFNKWQKLHQERRLIDFIDNQEGILWLKIKSIMRPELLKTFCHKYDIQLISTTKRTSLRNYIILS